VIGSGSIPAKITIGVGAICPANYPVALSGGVVLSDLTGGMWVTSSRPNVSSPGAAPNGWTSLVTNNNSTPQTAWVVAICSAVTGVYTATTSTSVSALGFSSTEAICPAGTVATGGGVDVTNNNNALPIWNMIASFDAPWYNGTKLSALGDGLQQAPN